MDLLAFIRENALSHIVILIGVIVGTRDGQTQSTHACLFFSFTWMVLKLPYILNLYLNGLQELMVGYKRR